MKRLPLFASFVLFVILCASLAYWGMQWFKPPVRAVAAPPPQQQYAPNLSAAAGLFGGRTTVAVATNYQLRGVVVAGDPASSVAILAADGKPAQAVRVNSELVSGVTVKEVHRQYVVLSEGGVSKRVELPDDAKGQGAVDFAARSPLQSRAQQTVPGISPPAVVQEDPAAAAAAQRGNNLPPGMSMNMQQPPGEGAVNSPPPGQVPPQLNQPR
ncbi:MAG: hypothetical protein JWQ23_3193 [Herminiimonas sp.]|nr:hypothetical protein [Herminiimonas sp.]